MSLTSYSPGDLANLPRWEKIALLSRLEPKAGSSESASDLTRYQSDPVAFAQEQLGFQPWARQAMIMHAVADHRRVAVRSCHNSGKTAMASCLVQWFTRCFEPSLVITTAPTSRQVEKQLWGEIATRQRSGGLPGRLTRLVLEVSPSQQALGFTTNEPEKFQGWHQKNILFVVDEASGVDETIYEAIEGCLTTVNAKLLLIGNPNNAGGTFFEAFRSDLYDKHHISAFDVPDSILPAGWAEERRQEWGDESPLYQVRVLGEFPDQGDDALIRMSWAQAAQERECDDGDTPGGTEIGTDIARYGGDESVAYVRRGGRVVHGEWWRGADTMASAGRIAALVRDYAGRTTIVKVDDIGVGGGVTDALKRELKDITVVGVNVGEAARDKEKFANRRAEIFWGLRERFRQGEISIPKDDALLLDQLTQIRFGYTPRGQIQIEGKDEMRKRRTASLKWQSPDRADALALAFCGGGRGFVPYVAGTELREM